MSEISFFHETDEAFHVALQALIGRDGHIKASDGERYDAKLVASTGEWYREFEIELLADGPLGLKAGEIVTVEISQFSVTC